MQLYWIAALAFGIIIAIFAVQNSEPATVTFLWLRVDNLVISVWILISATLGALVTVLFGLGRELRMRLAGRRSRRTIRALEQRVAELESKIGQFERDNADLHEKLTLAERAANHVIAAAGETLPQGRSAAALPGEPPDPRLPPPRR
ncbi:MAG: LapA family protein [Chloroflexi bacterium]|nr:LapA family protein [Chloroflexota bacterium]